METMGINPDFWNNRKVLVTGHTGFKGSWLSLWLQQLGSKLTGYSLLPPSSPNMFEACRIAEGMNSVHGDIRNLEDLKKTIGEKQPEIVIHLAAQALVRQSYDDPPETWSSNIIGTANVLEACRQCDSVRAVVIITTDKCYANQQWPWPYRETDTLGGYDPYSASKACAELVSSSYRDSFFKPAGKALATTRAGNVIGGGDWGQDRLIPDVITAVLNGQPPEIRSPHAVRPWQFVLEPLAGYLMLVERLYDEGDEFAEAWNFGPNQDLTLSVGEIVSRIGQHFDQELTWQPQPGNHPHETDLLRLDSSKAIRELGWQPKLNIEQTITMLCRWYQTWHDNPADIRDYTLTQIEEYQA